MKLIHGLILFSLLFIVNPIGAKPVNSDVIKFNGTKLSYLPDNNGNIIPDYSHAGYKGNNQAIPNIPVVHRISNYPVVGQLVVSTSGVVIRGEGQAETDTVIVATGTEPRSLIHIRGNLKIDANKSLQQKISDPYVAVGSYSFLIGNASQYKVGQSIIVLRPSTKQWITDIGMNKLPPRKDGRKITQWAAGKYDLKFERTIRAITGNKITIDLPIVQMMQDKYGGGYIYPATARGRIQHVGIENMRLVSTYKKGKINSRYYGLPFY